MGRLVAPLGWGVAQAIVASLLVVVALAAPSRQPGFRGIVNDTTSKGSGRRLELFRDAFGWLPGAGLTLTPKVYLWGLRGALVALAVIQLLALLSALREPPAPVVSWLIGPTLTAVVLLAYPPLSADVFYYAISGHVANLGANPYRLTPQAFPGDPFLPFNDWTTITSPYGPLWTSLSRVVVALSGPDPLRAVLAFKGVGAVAAVGLGLMTFRCARRVTGDPRRALGALVLVAWFPPLLIESAGTAHNDAVMMLCALSGFMLIARAHPTTTRAGLLLIAASALIKYVTLPLLGFAALSRLRRAERERGLPAVLRDWMLDAAAVIGLAVAVFAPYWVGKRTIDSLIKEPARLFVNPLWVLPRLAIVERSGKAAGDAFHRNVRAPAEWAVGLCLVAALGWLILRSWRVNGTDEADRSGARIEANAWAVATAALAFIPVNAHAWYLIWPAAPVALSWAGRASASRPVTSGPDSAREASTARPRLRWWLWLYLLWSTVSFVVYHSRAPN